MSHINRLLDELGSQKYCSVCGSVNYQIRPEYCDRNNVKNHGSYSKERTEECFFLVCNECGKQKIILKDK